MQDRDRSEIAGVVGSRGPGGRREWTSSETAPVGPPDHFGRIVALMKSNERLLKALAATRSQAAEAFAYLESPGGNRALGEARLDQLRAKRSGLLSLLRSNRLEAHAIRGRQAAA